MGTVGNDEKAKSGRLCEGAPGRVGNRERSHPEHSQRGLKKKI